MTVQVDDFIMIYSQPCNIEVYSFDVVMALKKEIRFFGDWLQLAYKWDPLRSKLRFFLKLI